MNGGLVALSIPMVVYLGMTLLHRPQPLNLSCQRRVSSNSVTIQTPVTVTVRVTNNGDDLEEVLISDTVPEGLEWLDGRTSILLHMPHGATAELRYTVRGLRGSYTFHDLFVSAADYQGILSRTTTLPARDQLVILPEVIRLKKVAIRPQRTHGHFGPIPSRQAGSGVDFYGLRDYQLGDPQRWINWRASARYEQNLFVNQFEQERIADVGMILDARQQSNIELDSGNSIFEYSVQAAGSISKALLDDGNRVSLLIYGFGMERTFRGYGKIQQEHILHALGQAKTGHNFALESLGYLPTRFFPAGCQIVMVSPLLSSDVPAFSELRAVGYEILLISPDPVDFEARALGLKGDLAWKTARVERALTLKQLQRLGIRVVDWQVDRPFEALVRATLSRPAPGSRIGPRGS